MARIHREGKGPLTVVAIVLLLIGATISYFIPMNNIALFILAFLLYFIWSIISRFFRVPNRAMAIHEKGIVTPCDGKVVVIEEVEETEYFKDKRIQISVFMSIYDVHQNFYPQDGEITYAKYHPGKFLVAFNPKSSTLNERTTTVVKNQYGEVLFRQIAGFMARRIKFYGKEGDQVKQNQEMGFIKFGSRLDIFIPVDAHINVKLNDVVRAGKSVLAQYV